ncbi:hypothetical protein CIB48_g7097, partial [Xylaria polymorpha]
LSMSNFGPPNIPATATAATSSSALCCRDRSLRNATDWPHHQTHQEYLHLQAELNRPLSPSPSVSSSESYSAVVAQVNEVLRNHDPYNYHNNEPPEWKGLGRWGGRLPWWFVHTEDGCMRGPEQFKWLKGPWIGEDDDLCMTQRDPYNEEEEELQQLSSASLPHPSSLSGDLCFEDADAEGEDIQERQEQAEALPSPSSDTHIPNVEEQVVQQPTKASSLLFSSFSPQDTSLQ